MADKGSKFERDICVTLSKWWTYDERDDVFWRIGGSGGRAKMRGRKGKLTRGQHGDICAADPIGDPLIQLLTIELKRGYCKFTCYDLMDMTENNKTQKWEEWLDQITESHRQAGSKYWLLIHKRDRRKEVVYMPSAFFASLEDNGCFSREWLRPIMTLDLVDYGSITGITLDAFLHHVDPADIKEILR